MSDSVDLDRILERRGLARETLRRPIKMEHLSRMAVKIGSDWKSCAAFLGIPNTCVEDIEHEEKKVRNMRIKVFSVWHELCGEDATYLKLAEVLADLGRKDLIELLIKLSLSINRTRQTSVLHKRVTFTKVATVCRGKSLCNLDGFNSKLIKFRYIMGIKVYLAIHPVV